MIGNVVLCLSWCSTRAELIQGITQLHWLPLRVRERLIMMFNSQSITKVSTFSKYLESSPCQRLYLQEVCLCGRLLFRKSARYTQHLIKVTFQKESCPSLQPPSPQLSVPLQIVKMNQNEHKWTNCETPAPNSGLGGGWVHRWGFLFKWNGLALDSGNTSPLFPSGFGDRMCTWGNGKRKPCDVLSH